MGIDLREVITGRISPAYVWMLCQQMPDGSATVAALRGGPQHRGWTLETHLLAYACDLLAGANYQRGGGKGRKPQPIERPRTKTTRVVRVADINRTRNQGD